jgi:hypothetical protein
MREFLSRNETVVIGWVATDTEKPTGTSWRTTGRLLNPWRSSKMQLTVLATPARFEVVRLGAGHSVRDRARRQRIEPKQTWDRSMATLARVALEEMPERVVSFEWVAA